MHNPLFLSDFLTSCLDLESQLDVQILALRAIFILLEKYGLDYPNYYKRLYGLLLPQYQEKTGQTVSVFHIDTQEKARFLRLLDLSLRSAKLPSRVIAAFLKRIARVSMTHGICHSPGDKMFVISLVANLIKRHPRCVRLIHRKKRIQKEVLKFDKDPFREEETDPSKARALKSSLWEIDALMKNEFDETVRNYSKLFRGDLSRKSNFFKCEDFAGLQALDSIAEDLGSIDIVKENSAINKSILIKHK